MKIYILNGGNNQPDPNGDRFAGLRSWLTVLLVVWVLSSIGLGWIINSFLILIGLAVVLPLLVAFGFGFYFLVFLPWWTKRNAVVDACPVCSHTFAAMPDNQFQCPNCGELLQVEQKKFVRQTQPGVIDVEVQTVD